MASKHRVHLNKDDIKKKLIQEDLLAWYNHSKRDLPWRHTKDPYAIWISEIMLQQTQVQTVIPYYERFLARFPNPQVLASSDLEEVLNYWAGLGYYSRARNLHAAAKMIVEKYNGVFPASRDEILALPGIGRYTVGAILSIALNQNEPILDGNVIRVLSRIYMISGDPAAVEVKEALWGLSHELIPNGYAGDFNQAMMELGACICTPLDPECNRCPVETVCLARQAGLQEEYPQLKKRPAIQRVREVAAVIEDKGLYLIAKRPPEGLWGGLWEFPRGRCRDGENEEDALIRIVNETLGVEIRIESPMTVIKHSVMHYSITLTAYHAMIVTGSPDTLSYSELRWISLDDIAKTPFSAPQAKLLKMLLKNKIQGSLSF